MGSKRIARELGVNRRTVRRYLETGGWQPYKKPKRQKLLEASQYPSPGRSAPQIMGFSPPALSHPPLALDLTAHCFERCRSNRRSYDPMRSRCGPVTLNMLAALHMILFPVGLVTCAPKGVSCENLNNFRR